MKLRSELLPPRWDRQQIDRLTELAQQIVAAMDAGENPDALIAELNAITHAGCDRAAFHYAAGAMSIREFVQSMLDTPPLIPDISDEEYTELIARLMNAQGTESEMEYWIKLLERNLGCPKIANLIFWPTRKLTADEVLQEARAYRPIAL